MYKAIGIKKNEGKGIKEKERKGSKKANSHRCYWGDPFEEGGAEAQAAAKLEGMVGEPLRGDPELLEIRLDQILGQPVRIPHVRRSLRNSQLGYE